VAGVNGVDAAIGLGQVLGHEDAARARGVAGDLAEHAPAVAGVETGGLEADRVEDAGPAAASTALILRLPQVG